MIWFACKQCGKRHRQPADAAGSLIFCECGQANRVPWESTVPAPEKPAGSEGPRPRPQRRRWSEADDEDEDDPSPRRRHSGTRRHDRSRCLNHEDTASAETCPDCGEAFCPRCVVEFEGLQLCGPCKNYRVRRLQRPPRVPGLAIGALVAGIGSAPLIFCITVAPLQSESPGAMFGCAVVGMGIGLAALLLGLAGLRQAEGKAAMGGRGLAMTGAACGAAGLLWSLSLAVITASRLVQG
jgi:hypothetical protein